MNDIISTSTTINTLWANVLVDELARCGVRRAVISPGSRSTPLVLAFVSHTDIEVTSILDERAAGFFALGAARAFHMPVVVLCTSGTAAANLLPAVCEANADGVPLIVLTADRPAVLQDTGAMQTMDQRHLFGSHARWFHELAKPGASDRLLRYLRTTICRAVEEAVSLSCGPVHVNVPFDKPLEPAATGGCDTETAAALAGPGQGLSGRPDGMPFVASTPVRSVVDHENVAPLADAFRNARRPLVIAGPDPAGRESAIRIVRSLDRIGVPVFAEAASGLRFCSEGAGCIVLCGDLLVRSAVFKSVFRPDLVVLAGGVPTIGAMQEFIESLSGIPVIAVSPRPELNDPNHVASAALHAPFADVCEALADALESGKPTDFDREWMQSIREADKHADECLRMRSASRSGCMQAAFWSALPLLLPAGVPVFVSNSMTLRDFETFVKSAPGIDVFCNRGISGIDGVTSTALGLAAELGRRTVLITGDSAFLHDLDALASPALHSIDLTIFVLNNDGGEIFKTLPVAGFEPSCTRHFTMPHGLNIASIANAFGVPSFTISDAADHARALYDLGAIHHGDPMSTRANTKRLRVIELRIDMNESLEWRKSVLSEIGNDMDEFLKSRNAIEAAPVPDGVPRLAYRRLTTSDDGSARPVVMLHGFTRSSKSWEPLAHAVGSSRVLYAIDLMGHGKSPKPRYGVDPSPYEMSAQADSVLEVMERLGLEKPHLAGYSMGGRLAMYLAQNAQDRFASVALLSANAGIEDDDLRARRKQEDEELASRIERDGLAAFLESWGRHPLLQSTLSDPRGFDALMMDRKKQSAEGLAGSLRGMGQGSQPSLWPGLADISIPILCVTGELDGNYTEIAHRMSAANPKLSARTLQNAGHDLVSDALRQLYELLHEFWSTAEHS